MQDLKILETRDSHYKANGRNMHNDVEIEALLEPSS